MVLEQLQTDVSSLLPLTEEAVTLESSPQLRQLDTLPHQAGLLLLPGLGQQAAGQAAVGRLGGGTEAE